MFVKSMKNFLRKLLYAFIPVGVVYLTLILALYTFASATVNIAVGLINDVAETTATDLKVSKSDAYEYFSDALNDIDWNKSVTTVYKEIKEKNWLTTTLNGFLSFVGSTSSDYADEVSALVTHAVSDIKKAAGILLTTVLIGLLASFFVCRIVLHDSCVSKKYIVSLLLYLCEGVYTALWLFLSLYLSTLWGPCLYIVGILGFIGFGFAALLNAWLAVGGNKVMPFKSAVNLRNILEFFAAALVILIAYAVFVVLLAVIFDIIIALVVGLPVIVYNITILSVNASSYVASITEKTEAQ